MSDNPFGYTVWLHEVGTPWQQGFGYRPEKLDEVQERRDLWNTYSADSPVACIHQTFLKGDKCQLCGKRYQVTVPDCK